MYSIQSYRSPRVQYLHYNGNLNKCISTYLEQIAYPIMPHTKQKRMFILYKFHSSVILYSSFKDALAIKKWPNLHWFFYFKVIDEIQSVGWCLNGARTKRTKKVKGDQGKQWKMTQIGISILYRVDGQWRSFSMVPAPLPCLAWKLLWFLHLFTTALFSLKMIMVPAPFFSCPV